MRLRQLFGLEAGEQLNIDNFLELESEDYKEQAEQVINNALNHGENCDFSYTIRGDGDQKLRWLRVLENMNYDASGAYAAFTGVVMDVTEQKQDEQRKNDLYAWLATN